MKLNPNLAQRLFSSAIGRGGSPSRRRNPAPGPQTRKHPDRRQYAQNCRLRLSAFPNFKTDNSIGGCEGIAAIYVPPSILWILKGWTKERISTHWGRFFMRLWMENRPGIVPFKKVSLREASSGFFQELNRAIQRGYSRRERTKNFPSRHCARRSKTFSAPIERTLIPIPSRDREDEIPARGQVVDRACGTGFVCRNSFTIWDLFLHDKTTPSVEIATSVPAVETPAQIPGAKDSSSSSAASLGPQHAGFDGPQQRIDGGTLSLPPGLLPSKSGPLQVQEFFIDQFFVTNQQYVEFLNRNLPNLSVENAQVKSHGGIGCCLEKFIRVMSRSFIVTGGFR